MFSSKLSLKTKYALAIGQFWLHSPTNISSMEDFLKERDQNSHLYARKIPKKFTQLTNYIVDLEISNS